jgi:hypothetical protein
MTIELLNCPCCGWTPIEENGFFPAESIYYAMCQNTKCCLYGNRFDIDEWNKEFRESIDILVDEWRF